MREKGALSKTINQGILDSFYELVKRPRLTGLTSAAQHPSTKGRNEAKTSRMGDRFFFPGERTREGMTSGQI